MRIVTIIGGVKPKVLSISRNLWPQDDRFKLRHTLYDTNISQRKKVGIPERTRDNAVAKRRVELYAYSRSPHDIVRRITSS